jgi:hypothetical protein
MKGEHNMNSKIKNYIRECLIIADQSRDYLYR